MSERQVDAERAGGTGNAAPKRAVGADPVGLDEAMARADDMERRLIRTRSRQAMIALRDGVHELRGEVFDARCELACLRAGLSDVIACPYGDGTTCTRDNYGWSPCCSARIRMGKAGLISAPVREAEQDDAA